VVATCRRSSPELDALGVHVVDGIDVTEATSAARLSEAVGDAALDLLVVNAGVNLSFDVDRIDDLDLALVEEELLVNAVGAARTVLAVLPNLGRGAKILLVSSGVTRPGRPGVGSIGYTMSKGALNFFGRALAHDVHERGIVVVLVSPGATDTDIIRRVNAAGRNPLPAGTVSRDPLDSARNVLGIVERASLESSGTFWGPAGETYFAPDGTPAVG
jgi:NAD(P)-dependent dehydrogenase (short-subunit alcohol dehydrogenase family)